MKKQREGDSHRDYMDLADSVRSVPAVRTKPMKRARIPQELMPEIDADRQFIAGACFGWNCGVTGDHTSLAPPAGAATPSTEETGPREGDRDGTAERDADQAASMEIRMTRDKRYHAAMLKDQKVGMTRVTVHHPVAMRPHVPLTPAISGKRTGILHWVDRALERLDARRAK